MRATFAVRHGGRLGNKTAPRAILRMAGLVLHAWWRFNFIFLQDRLGTCIGLPAAAWGAVAASSAIHILVAAYIYIYIYTRVKSIFICIWECTLFSCDLCAFVYGLFCCGYAICIHWFYLWCALLAFVVVCRAFCDHYIAYADFILHCIFSSIVALPAGLLHDLFALMLQLVGCLLVGFQFLGVFVAPGHFARYGVLSLYQFLRCRLFTDFGHVKVSSIFNQG